MWGEFCHLPVVSGFRKLKGLFRFRRRKKAYVWEFFFSAPLFDINMQLFLSYNRQLISGSTRPIITNFWIYLYSCIDHSNLPPFDKKKADKKGLKKGSIFQTFFQSAPFFLFDFSIMVVNYCVRKLP